MINQQMIQMLSQLGGMNGMGSNPLQMMNMLKGNPSQMMNMLGGNPMMQQAQKMMSSGGDPRTIIQNVAQQMGVDQNQLNQMAQMFGLKL